MTATRPATIHRCAICGRKLKAWVYSRATGARYCLEGQGCQKRRRR